MALAFIAAGALLARRLDAQGFDAKLAEKAIIWSALSGFLGARIWFLIEYWDQLGADPWSAIFAGSGFTFLGGFLAAIGALAFFANKHKIGFLNFLDLSSVPCALAYCVGRLGCQLSGDGDYGQESSSWFAMSYSSGVVPTPPGVTVLATPLFESLMALVIVWILLKVESLKLSFKPGFIFGAFLVLMSMERIIIEIYRIERAYAYGLTSAQFASIFIAIAGATLMALALPRAKIEAR